MIGYIFLGGGLCDLLPCPCGLLVNCNSSTVCICDNSFFLSFVFFLIGDPLHVSSLVSCKLFAVFFPPVKAFPSPVVCLVTLTMPFSEVRKYSVEPGATSQHVRMKKVKICKKKFIVDCPFRATHLI